jgi:hypothetical protein
MCPSKLQTPTPTTLVDTLTYSSYAHNRQLTPYVTPEQWRVVFGERTAALEARYQDECREVMSRALEGRL